MAEKVAVIVPGILGSVLYYPSQHANLELWGENLFDNYKLLCEQPNVLDWVSSGNPAQSRLLKSIRTSRCVPYVKSTIYEKLTAHAKALP